MADYNETVEINYKADLKDLLNNLKKIPGLTEKEAKKMVKQLDRQLKQAEKAAKRTGRNAAKSMDEIGHAATRSKKGIRAFQRESANLDRLTGELAAGLDKVFPALGGIMHAASAAAGSVEGVARAFLITHPALITGAALFGVLGGAYYLFTEASKEAEEAEKNFAETLNQNSAQLRELNEELTKLEKTYGDFQSTLNNVRTETDLLTGSFSEADIAELRFFEQAQKRAVSLTEAEEEVRLNLIEQRKVRMSSLKEMEKALKRHESISKSEKISVHFLEQQEMFLSAVTGLKGKIASLDAEILESENKIAGAFQDEADSLEKALQQRAEEEARIKRIAEAQKIINDRIKEYDKVLKEIMKPLASFENQVRQSQASQSEQLTLQEKLRKAGLKLREQQLKLELASAEEEEKRALLSEITANKEQQINQESQKQLAALRAQADSIRERQEQAQLDLDRARAQLETEEEILASIKSKKEQKEKLLKLQQAQDELSVKEGMLEKQRILDAETLEQISMNQMNIQLQGVEQVNLAREEAHQAEMERQKKQEDALKRTVQGVLKESMKLAQDLSAIGNKFAEAQIAGLNQQIEISNQEREKSISQIEELEKRGQLTAEQAAERKKAVELSYAESVKDEQLKIFKTQQQAAIAQAVIDGASAAARAFKDYPFPASLGIAALAAAASAKQVQVIKAQQAPTKFDVGGMIGTNNAPDSLRVTALRGEAILDRGTVNNLGGEQGVRALQNNQGGSQVVVIQPFRHFDRFVNQANKSGILGNRRTAAGRY